MHIHNIIAFLMVAVMPTEGAPQFFQNYHPGSQSQNFNGVALGSIPGMQQIFGGSVVNTGGSYRQNYFGGSRATNIGKYTYVSMGMASHPLRVG